jgi:hypothetical protein
LGLHYQWEPEVRPWHWIHFFICAQQCFDRDVVFQVVGDQPCPYDTEIIEELHCPLVFLTGLRDDFFMLDSFGRNDVLPDDGYHVAFELGGDLGYNFTQCPSCGIFGFEFEARAERLRCGCPKSESQFSNGNAKAIAEAYRLAANHLF